MNESFKDAKVLITGANGFIGSHLFRRMLKQGAEVSIVVRETSNMWRINDVLNQCNVYKMDLTRFEDIEHMIKALKPDYIFHMAAYGVNPQNNNPNYAITSNILVISNIINSLKTIGCKKLIISGSGSEYGNYTDEISENAELKPTSLYGSTKAAGTIIAHQLAAAYDIDIVTLRIFGVFGEFEEGYRFIPNVIISVLKDTDINLTFCEQYRDLCYIENIVDGFILAASNFDIKNEIFNIASGEPRQLKNYVDMVIKHMKTNKIVNYGKLQYRENEIWYQKADICKITKLIGWMPRISFEEGLIKTINWFSENHNLFLQYRK